MASPGPSAPTATTTPPPGKSKSIPPVSIDSMNSPSPPRSAKANSAALPVGTPLPKIGSTPTACRPPKPSGVLERYAKLPERPFFLALGFFRPPTPLTSLLSRISISFRERLPIIKLEAPRSRQESSLPRPRQLSHGYPKNSPSISSGKPYRPLRCISFHGRASRQRHRFARPSRFVGQPRHRLHQRPRVSRRRTRPLAENAFFEESSRVPLPDRCPVSPKTPLLHTRLPRRSLPHPRRTLWRQGTGSLQQASSRPQKSRRSGPWMGVDAGHPHSRRSLRGSARGSRDETSYSGYSLRTSPVIATPNGTRGSREANSTTTTRTR